MEVDVLEERVLKSEFVTSLVGELIDDTNFRLSQDLIYNSKLLGREIFVPEGFITDFASVPRVPLIYGLFGNKAHHESVLHDYLYRTLPHICSRLQADEIFLEAMEVRKKSWFIRRTMYLGVRIGGKSSWK